MDEKETFFCLEALFTLSFSFLRLEKVVASKQLRLAVETDRRRKNNKTGSFSEKLATMLIIQT